MAVGNDTVKTNLVEVWSLELQHLVDAGTVDGVSGLLDLFGSTLSTTETGLNELLAVLVEKVKGWLVSTGRDLDKLCESVSDLSLWESSEEAKVEEGVDWSVVSTKAVFVVAVVDGDLDADRGINETDHGGRNADVVRVAAVRGTGEAIEWLAQFVRRTGHRLGL